MPKSPELKRVIDQWQPASRNEESKRAYFFLHLLGAHSLAQLQHFLGGAQHGPTISIPDVLRAVKVIVCVSTHLAVLESSEGTPNSWLMDWLLQVLTQLDEMLPDPPARELTETVCAHDTATIMKLAAESTCSMLNLQRESDQQALVAMIKDAHGYRNELLVMSLSQPLDDLRDHISLFG